MPRIVMFRLKIYRQGKEILVASCDADLVGREFREGKLQIIVKEAFYGTDLADEETLVRHLSFCTIANLVGRGVVGVAIRHGFVDPDNVLEIAGVPHAQLATL